MAVRRVVQLDVPAADVERASDVLWRGGPAAVSEAPLAGDRVRLVADVTDPDAFEVAEAGWVVEVVAVEADSALDAWRPWARPVRPGQRVVLQPSWLPVEGVSANDIVVLLDAGHAFGSGSHPSTRLAVRGLEALVVSGGRVLDVGCGSGVLAVTAALLGAGRVDAIDIDPAAVSATGANADRNGVGSKIRVSSESLSALRGPYDLVVANIGARVLTELAADLHASVRVGGTVLLSGLLEAQVDEVVARFSGVEEVAREVEDGWAAPVLRRR